MSAYAAAIGNWRRQTVRVMTLPAEDLRLIRNDLEAGSTDSSKSFNRVALVWPSFTRMYSGRYFSLTTGLTSETTVGSFGYSYLPVPAVPAVPRLSVTTTRHPPTPHSVLRSMPPRPPCRRTSMRARPSTPLSHRCMHMYANHHVYVHTRLPSPSLTRVTLARALVLMCPRPLL